MDFNDLLMVFMEIPLQTLEAELQALQALSETTISIQRSLRVEGAIRTLRWLLGQVPAPSIQESSRG